MNSNQVTLCVCVIAEEAGLIRAFKLEAQLPIPPHPGMVISTKTRRCEIKDIVITLSSQRVQCWIKTIEPDPDDFRATCNALLKSGWTRADVVADDATPRRDRSSLDDASAESSRDETAGDANGARNAERSQAADGRTADSTRGE